MIQVSIHNQSNLIQVIELKGHAQSGEYGKDLVCSGVSAIVYGIANTLAKKRFYPENVLIDLQEGYVRIEVIQSCPEIQLILETFEISLETVEEAYPQYLKILKTEV